MDLWQYVKNLLKAESESSPLKPFIQEPLERLETETAAYELWKRTLAKEQVLEWLNVQYATFVMQPDALIDTTIDFLNTPSAKGFVIHFDEQLHNHNDFFHLFDYLKEQVLSMNYRNYMSDVRTYNRTRNNKNWVETIERHYLKPRLVLLDEQKMDQRFGNIKIELLLKNEVIKNLQFSATRYQDRNFNDGNTFSELMRALLQS